MDKKAYEHTRYLVEECGIRIAGTREARKAADYIGAQFESFGLDVYRHTFTTPICFVKKSELKATLDGKTIEMNHLPALFSKATPEGGIDLPLVYAENGSPGVLSRRDVAGKAVLICRDVYADYPDVETYKLLEQYGVKMVIYSTSDGQKDIPYVYANYETMYESYTIPTAVIHYNEGLKLAKAGEVSVHFDVQFDVQDGDSVSVIGTLEGADSSAGEIIVCAHVDSSMGSYGATDDAAGVGMVMALAEYYAHLKKKGELPKRTIRFIGWSGHECGLHGSRNFLLKHPLIFHAVKFVLNYDVVGNAMGNYMMGAGVNNEVKEILEGIVEKLQLGWPVNPAPLVCDTLNFATKEIQQITLSSGCFAGNHTKHDNMDLLSEYGLVSPLEFSKEVIEWAANADDIPQGYPDDLNGAMRYVADRYQWGLFNKI